MKIDSVSCAIAVHALLVELFDWATISEISPGGQKPLWVSQLKEILHDSATSEWTLQGLVEQLGIHPVHLCRAFSRYFQCSLGEYIRSIKVQQAMGMLGDNDISLTAIAATCGFADQSHFNRNFRSQFHITPLAYRKLMAKLRC